MTEYSEEAGCVLRNRASSFLAASSTAGGICAASTAFSTSSISPAPSLSPNSRWMAFICSRRNISR
jgi:hypothetical protein